MFVGEQMSCPLPSQVCVPTLCMLSTLHGHHCLGQGSTNVACGSVTGDLSFTPPDIQPFVQDGTGWAGPRMLLLLQAPEPPRAPLSLLLSLKTRVYLSSGQTTRSCNWPLRRRSTLEHSRPRTMGQGPPGFKKSWSKEQSDETRHCGE